MRSYRVVIAFLTLGLLVVLNCLPGAALAAPFTGSTVAVLGIEPSDVPEALAQQLTDALRSSIRSVTGLKQVQGKDLLEIKMVFGCDNEAASCFAQAGRSLGADILVIGIAKKSVRAIDTVVQLRLIDVKRGVQVGSFDEVVNRSDLGTRADAWLARLFGTATPVPAVNPAVLYVASVPSGAEVSLDGSVVGRTPLTASAATPGRHSLMIATPGYDTVWTSVDLVPGKRIPLDFRLTKKVTPLPVPTMPTNDPISAYEQRRTIPGVRTAHAVIGVGIAAVVIGGAFAAVSIWSWYSYTNIENDLGDRVPLFVPNRPATSDEATWLQKPSCSPPSSLAEFGNTIAFASDCKEGRSLAATTTALVATATVFGVAGLATIVAGWQLEKRARNKAEKATTFLFTPVLAPGYLGASAAGRF